MYPQMFVYLYRSVFLLMHMFVFMYQLVCVNGILYVYLYLRAHQYIYQSCCLRVFLCWCIHICVFMRTFTYTHRLVYMSDVCIHICICEMYAYVYIYILTGVNG